MSIRLVMLGDIVGTPGRQAVAQLVPAIRQQWSPDLIIANGENVANGSGITPSQFVKLRKAGIDGVTLGDHVYRRSEIVSTLETDPAIIRPANLPPGAKGRTWMRLNPNPTREDSAGVANSKMADGERTSGGGGKPSVFVTTVLGRIFTMLPANDPFATIDQVLKELPEADPIVVVEVHAEATSEKQALGRYLDGRVSAVIGTHTHVPTADAKILPKGTAYIADIGMCGPHDSILGRRVDRVLTHMTTGMHAPFDVAEGDVRVNGIFVEIDPASRRALAVQRIELKADQNAPPFTFSS